MIARAIRPMLAAVAVALAVWQVDLLLDVLRGNHSSNQVETATVKKGSFIVGISREGAIESADVMALQCPESGSTITWLIDDSAEVKAGDLVAKVEVGEFRFEVERQKLEHQNRVSQVEQQRRDRTRDYESADLNVEKTLRSLEMLSRSQFTETEQSQAQINYDRWNVTFGEQDYDKQTRLRAAGIVPETSVEQSERSLRSRQHGLAKSEKESTYLEAEHSSKKAQSQSDIDTSQFESGLAKRRIGEAVQSAQEQVELSAEQLRRMEEQLAAGELRASKAGIVILGKTWGEGGRRTIREGDRVWSSMKIADVTNLESLQVKLIVDENSIHRLRVGQDVVITVKTAPDKQFAGKITSIGAVAREVSRFEDPTGVPGQRVFDVVVRIVKPDIRILRPGISAKVQFVSARRNEAVYVPLSAVFDKPEGQVAYVRKGAGFVSRRIKTGDRNDEAVVVLEGLKSGEQVALSDPTRTEAP